MKRLIVFILLAVLGFLSSCKKSTSFSSPSVVDVARVWYNTQLSGSSSFRLLWESAREVRTWKQETVLDVPISSIGALSKQRYNLHKSVLFLLDENRRIRAAKLVFTLRPKSELNAELPMLAFDSPYSADFCGYVKMQTLPSGRSNSYAVNTLQIDNHRRIVSQYTNAATRVVATQNANGIFSGDCGFMQCDEPPCDTWIEWYLVTYDETTGQIISSEYVGYTCVDDSGGGGGGGGNGDVTVDDGYLYTCPDNFTFVSVTNSDLWQESALSNIYCQMTYINMSTGQMTTKTVDIDVMYFGVPYYDINGNLIYTKNDAKAFAAAALNLAEFETREKFKSNPSISTQSLRDYWIERTNYHMKQQTLLRGKADKHGSSNPANPVVIRPYAPC